MRRVQRKCGAVPKRSKGADCKSAGLCLRRFESFPLHQTTGFEAGLGANLLAMQKQSIRCQVRRRAGVAQLARASAFQAEGREFESRLPLASQNETRRMLSAPRLVRAHVAQVVEHFLGKEEVTGSSPVVGFSGRTANRVDDCAGRRQSSKDFETGRTPSAPATTR